MPPCFARATVVGKAVYGAPAALLGGTASICGEETMHVGDPAAQIEETFRNLVSLVRAAREDAGVAEDEAALSGLRELRVYHPREADAEMIKGAVSRRCPQLRRLEVLRAELCRRELLVEIEGLAEMPPFD
jgi:chorismate lyase/3-hydroxybenzoate synthase